MAKRVLFVPFILTASIKRPGRDYVNKNAGWIESYQLKQSVLDENEAHAIYQSWYRPNKPSPMIAALGADDQLYIRGHSMAGIDGIFDHASQDESGRNIHQSQMDQTLFLKLNDGAGTKQIAFMLKASDVFDRLVESGLKASFAGTIKCYNCHSAEGHTNFATALAEKLTANGYTQCTVYGYTGALSSKYDGKHKTSATTHRGITTIQRSSEARVLIRGPG